MMRLPKLKFLVIALLLTVASMFMTHGSARAYYGGGLYGGAGLYGLGGGLYGGLYGSGYGGLYGGLYGGGYGGLYGGGYGLYGLYGGGLYGGYGLGGGLYGSSLYGGLGGLYGGYSGLYGGLGLYGLGGMGSYGLYGLGGLGTDPYGLGRYYLGNGSEALGRASDVLLTGGGTSLLSLLTTTSVAPVVPVAPTVTVTVPIYPDPTGLYYGSWTSLSSGTGTMNMNLTYTILNVSVTGTAGLILNKLIPIAINVGGLNNAPSFILTGTYINPLVLVSYSLILNCAFSPATLTLPAIIQGTYFIHDPLYLKTDSGTFSVGRL